MQINLSKPFKHQALAEALAEQALIDDQASFEQMEKNWKIARAGKDLRVGLAARVGMFEYVAAAAILGKSAEVESAGKAVIKWGCELAEYFKPAPELLLVELCLAISRADRPARRQLAKAILDQPAQDNYYNLERAQSLSLAALFDLDYDAAARHAQRLYQASSSGEFDKADSLLAGLWADVIRHLALKDVDGCFAALELAHAAFSRQVDLQLGRLKQGSSSDISAFDLVDWPTGACLQLLQEFGLKRDAHQKKNSPQGPGF